MEGKFQFTLGLIFCILFLLWGGIRIYNNVVFDIQCADRLKRAADANTIQLAKEELRAALDYMEREELTSGYTSVLYNTPDEDIGFWYKNIKSSYEELISLSYDVTGLERSNMLMKLRETILDTKDGKTSVTFPTGISIYPRNVLFTFWSLLSLFFCAVFWIWSYVLNDRW